MFTDLNIKTKLLICFLFITFLAIPTEYYSIRYTDSIVKKFNNITNITFPKIQALFEMQNKANEIKTLTLNFNFNEVRSVQSEGSSAAKYKYNILASLAEMDKWENQYKNYLYNNVDDLSLNISDLDSLKSQIILYALKIMELSEHGASSVEMTDARQSLIQAQDKLANLISSGINNELSLIQKNQESASKTAKMIAEISIFIGISSILLSIIISLLLAHTLAKPIVELSRISTMITKGDLNQTINIKSNDEIGKLSKNMHLMIQSLLNANTTMKEKNEELSTALDTLKSAQKTLIESEKMASIGNMVASVSHEVNTPLGIGITAISHLREKFDEIESLLNSNKLKRSDFETFLHSTKEATHLTEVNLNRSLELIRSFKQISADNSSETRRIIQLNSYIKDILLSMKPILKKTKLKVSINCPENVILDTYPGILFQVLTILVSNSIIHGFEEGQEGTISILVLDQGNEIKIIYEDTGKGISKENLKKIFTPFFTTRRNSGGVGLGLYIAYTKIFQVLKGSIKCESDKGVTFIINMPKKTPELMEGEQKLA